MSHTFKFSTFVLSLCLFFAYITETYGFSHYSHNLLGKDTFRVAVVGSGIGGSAATHFLTSSFPHELRSKLNVTVFEQTPDRVCGRVMEKHLHNNLFYVEVGGSVIHSSNEYMSSFIELLNLTRTDSDSLDQNQSETNKLRLILNSLTSPIKENFKKSDNDLIKDDDTIGIWDGTSFLFQSSSNSILNNIKMLWRYGLKSLKNMSNMVEETIAKFATIYQIQNSQEEALEAFETPAQLMDAMNLVAETQITGYDYFLEQHNLDQRLVDEIINSISRVNYNQDLSLNAFAALVSSAGGGIGGTLFAVKEGNAQVCNGLLKRSRANVRMGRQVTQITLESKTSGVQYHITSQDSAQNDTNNNIQTEAFDAVIIAAPLELSGGIKIHGVKVPIHTRHYQSTHATFVEGRLNPAYFHAHHHSDLSSLIITTPRVDSMKTVPFTCVAINQQKRDPETGEMRTIYKLFSKEPISDEQLRKIFVEIRGDVFREPWKAYTVLRPQNPHDWPPFKLHDGLFYVNAFESPISCMETEAIAGRNAALLALQYFKEIGTVTARV